ncbi:MAG: ABC transporter permease [Parvibaculum sp.]|uniref:ABC transporter permease n=1 Tax=Parvibaculum sp. TaxID=2024848 RepID=UPI002AB83221|nr:ABC transporter permease [Parvibaculum sp.]MDZ4381339.1 ABC transporter permease [Parvibaculum sp.]
MAARGDFTLLRSLLNIARLGVKELRSLRSDPVLVFLIVYAFSFGIYEVATGVKFEVSNASVAIVDEDRSPLSRQIAAALLPPYFQYAEQIGAEDANQALDDGAYVFILDIPPHFERDLLSGKTPTLQLNVDATAMSMAGTGASYIQSIVTEEVTRSLRATGKATKTEAELIARALFNPNLDSVPFTSVMEVINNITLLSVILAGAALIREREHGTLEHLLVMPVTAIEIMSSKLWANGLVIVLAATLSLILMVEGILGVRTSGSLALFIAGALLYQFSVTALGILLATFTSSMAQYGLLVMPVLILMQLLSGSSTPLESMPVWLQNTMQISPSTHFVAFSQAILYRGAGVAIVWPQLAVMAGIGAAFFLIALARFRRAILRG